MSTQEDRIYALEQKVNALERRMFSVQAIQQPMSTPSFTQGQPSVEPQRDIRGVSTHEERSGKRFLRRLKVIVTVIALIALMIVVAMISAASFSMLVNTFLAKMLHVDIRAEIAYLWQLIHHL